MNRNLGKKYGLWIILALLLTMTACTIPQTINRQTEYHEETKEIEQYILDSLGEYITFNQPSIDQEHNRITMHAVFVSEYVNDENKTGDYPLVYVMDQTRNMVNSFLESNQDYFDYKYINLSFSIAPEQYDGPQGFITVGYLHSSYLGGDTNYLCDVNYFQYLNPETITQIDCNGIKQVELLYEPDVERIVSIICNMPDLEYVTVNSTYNIINTLSELRPDITFVEN